MTPVADRQEDTASTGPHLVQPWPLGVSREPVMRISDVLAALGGDFPALTPSKLRFLEEQGLVTPRRTAGGYRQYSAADVERLRFVLRQQRDRYLPLRVIADQLAELDAGTAIEPLVPRLVTKAGERTPPAVAGRYTAAALAQETGAGIELIGELIDSGVLSVDRSGHLDGWAPEVVRVAGALAEHGVEPRHLRPVRSAADREVAIAEQIAAPLRGQRAVAAQAHAATVAAEIGELFARLHAALVRAGVDDLDG
jgi:DNA-binding transcriptional MerR regulator